MNENKKTELNSEELSQLVAAISKQKEVSALCKMFAVEENLLLGYISELKDSGLNISLIKKNGILYVTDYGDQNVDFNEYSINGFKNKNQIKLALLSDTRFGSKFQQLSIVNDFYRVAIEKFNVDFFIHCGDICEGRYPDSGKRAIFNQSIFAHGIEEQSDLIVNQYPYVKKRKTYFITGEKDQSHMDSKQQRDIGKMIASQRDDLIYLGQNQSFLDLNNLKIYLEHKSDKMAKQEQTVSLRPQNTVRTMRSEDKVDILLQGHSLYRQAFRMRGIECVTAPSMVATTPEMRKYEIANTVGGWILFLTLNNGKLEKMQKLAIPYYTTVENDYLKAKNLVLRRK